MSDTLTAGAPDSFTAHADTAHADIPLEHAVPPSPAAGVDQAGQGQPLPLFTRAALREFVDARTYDYVNLPALGHRARVQSLITTEVEAVENKGVKVSGKKARFELQSVRDLIVAYGVVDELGQRLFNPNDPQDLRFIGRLDNRLTSAIAKRVRDLSGMNGDEDEEDEEGK